MNNLPQQYAYRVSARELPANDRPTPLHKGDVVTSFRGEDWSFGSVSRPAYGNSTGRVSVYRDCPDSYDRSPSQGGGRECVHMWHPGGVDVQEYFPSVFDLYLGTESGEEA